MLLILSHSSGSQRPTPRRAHNEISVDTVGLEPGPCFPIGKSAELPVLLTLLLIEPIYLKIYVVQFIYLFGVFVLGFCLFLELGLL